MFKGLRLSGWMALAVFATVGGTMVAAAPAFAAVDVDKLTISGEARERYEVRTDTSFVDTPKGKSNESAASQRIRVGVGYDLTPDVKFFAQIQDARIWGNEVPGALNSFAGVSGSNNNGTGTDLHQGYLQLNNVLLPGLSLKAGRQEMYFGDHRLIGNFNWSQIGIAFDGVRATYASKPADLDLFWVRIYDPTGGAAAPAGLSTSGVIFPANGTNNSGKQNLYGAYLTLKPVQNWTIEPYWMWLKNDNILGTNGAAAGVGAAISTPQAPDQSRHTFGGRINGKQGIGGGTLDTTIEANWQLGSIAAPPGSIGGVGADGHNLNINAHAEAAKIGYTFDAVPMKPRIGFEFDYASGDKCVNGNRGQGCGVAGQPGSLQHFNTFENLFPTNHGLYGNMDLQAWRNAVMYQFNASVQPSPASTLKFAYILHRLANTTDNWYRAGQVGYVTTGASNQEASLGQELNVTYWHTFKEKFLLEGGFGHFFTGAFFNNNPNIATGAVAAVQGSSLGALGVSNVNQIVDQNWAYVMGTVKF